MSKGGPRQGTVTAFETGGPDAARGPDETAVRAQLAKILGSEHFSGSRRMSRFLDFVVGQSLAGSADRLKEYTLAVEVFERPADFDPKDSNIVRVEAGRLRRRLDSYYLNEGAGDPVRIELPKGAYAPCFRRSKPEPAEPAAPRATPEPLADLPRGPAIAVLPFDSMSDKPGDELFADGMTEEILNDLSRFTDLFVMARHSTFQFKGRFVDVRDVGRDLGVDYVLEGSIRRAGDRVRVTAQLLETRFGAHVFSETYDRNMSSQDLIDIQDEIADHVSAAVARPFGAIGRDRARAVRRKAPDDLDAYESVLLFHAYWMGSDIHDAHLRARESLERTVARQPDYASAWAALALIYAEEGRLHVNSREGADPVAEAYAAARRAVELEPVSSLAQQALMTAAFVRGDVEEFRAAAERALHLNPNHADMVADVGIYAYLTGEWERGLALARKAIALAPVHPGWFRIVFALDHYRKGRFEDALIEARKGAIPDYSPSLVLLAMINGRLGRIEDARRAMEALAKLHPGFVEGPRRYFEALNMPADFVGQCLEGIRQAEA